MGNRLDRFRSVVRNLAQRAKGAFDHVTSVTAVREAVREIRERRARIPERVLARAVLHAGTVSAASVRTRAGRIEITAELASGKVIRATLIPSGARFAPRGAKELFFDVDPPEAIGEPELRAMAGRIAAAVARALWGPLLPRSNGERDGGALADREEGRLRIDLRTCPAVRAVLTKGGPVLFLLDALSIERFEVDERGLSFQIALPTFPFGA
jgi:hypothetical protein